MGTGAPSGPSRLRLSFDADDAQSWEDAGRRGAAPGTLYGVDK